MVAHEMAVDAVLREQAGGGVVERLEGAPGAVEEVVPPGVQLAAGGHARHGADVGVIERDGPGGEAVGRLVPDARAEGRVIEDVQAFWPYWFEFNKEWILAEKLRERRSRSPLSENSSVWWFR